jgi:AcrR family transcriptional regulator
MARREITPRKQPRQARSKRTKDDLLDGATRVLSRDGAERFTTNRVAAATGVSIGTLYQYFDGKAALLAATHERDGERLFAHVLPVLGDPARPARERLTSVLAEVFASQAAGAALHAALDGASVTSRDTTQLAAMEQATASALEAMIRDAAPSRAEVATELGRHGAFVIFSQLARLAVEPVDDPRALGVRTARMLADHFGF